MKIIDDLALKRALTLLACYYGVIHSFFCKSCHEIQLNWFYQGFTEKSTVVLMCDPLIIFVSSISRELYEIRIVFYEGS